LDSKVIIKGIKWTSIEFAFRTLFSFLVKLFLAKLLLPDDFGLVGMTSIFIAVVSAASELGMGAALIQKKDSQYAERLYNTAFWSGLTWGLVLFLIMCFAIGPFAASFYNEPILIKLMPILSIGILLKPLNLIHTVILTRAMNFKKLAMIQNGAALVAGLTALLTAYLGFGVWALTINNFLVAFLCVPMLFLATRWKPKIEWEKNYFKEIFTFGVYSTSTDIFRTTTYNIDNLMIGKFLGASSLGAYTLAFSLTEVLRQTISSILNKVMYPVFGQLQDNKEKLKNYFLKIININAIGMYPLMSFFLLFAKELILGIFGIKWVGAILPLKILAVAIMIHLIINSYTSLLRAMGYPGLEFKIIMGNTLLVLIPGLYFGITQWGLLGAALAILVNKVILVAVALWVLRKHIDISLLDISTTLKGSVFAIGIASLLTLVLKASLSHIHWIVFGSTYFLIYIASILFFEKNTLLTLKKNLL